MGKNQWHPPSLLDLFQAPEDYQGHFGWVCGYSANAGFMDSAAERFSGLTHGQRAYEGQVKLALVLDPHNEALSFVDAPGVAHCPFRPEAALPFRLLHAKVALLGFKHLEETERWLLRLLVSTGNWTRQTLEESLDLAWHVDIDSAELADVDEDDEDLTLRCADVSAASALLRPLRPLVDSSLTTATEGGSDTGLRSPWQDLDSWADLCSETTRDIKPRFFDNRSEPLLGQLAPLIKTHGKTTRRNYLAMGSGFFESTNRPDDDETPVPSVLHNTVGRLRSEKLLSATAETDVFVEPSSCQAVAVAAGAMRTQGYTIRKQGQPPTIFPAPFPRRLHAKFLFSAHWRSDASECNSAWVYLGSGNLTGPGFLNTMSSFAGNLEAGVVFAPEGLQWEHAAGSRPESQITNRLPIQWDKAVETMDELTPGDAMDVGDIEYLAPPIAWLDWTSAERGGILSARSAQVVFDVLTESDDSCPKTSSGFLWSGERPRQVKISWQGPDTGTRHGCLVPVVDETGRIAATPLPALDMDEASSQLASFPDLPGDDELDDPDTPIPDGHGTGTTRATTSRYAYPVREMMELVEHIAETQIRLTEHDWPAWCRRLQQTLRQLKPNAPIDYFQSLDINPLSPLTARPFRPVFAEDAATDHGKLYEAALQDVMAFWEVSNLSPIGERSS